MIDTENPTQHLLMKDIANLTLLLKTRHPELYAHLDETPVFESEAPGDDLTAMKDYQNTLIRQLKDADTLKDQKK